MGEFAHIGRTHQYNPLAELIQGILNSADGFVINEIHILRNGQCTNFGNDSGVQTTRYLGVISYGEELVGKL